jgi:hypothetical protein
MANCKTHEWIGMAAGGGVAAFRARREPFADQLVEAVGGAIGGYFGGKTPDILEPAIHGWHRDICHSWTVGGLVAKGVTTLGRWEKDCRDRAADFRRRRLAAGVPPLTAFFYWLAEMFWNLAAGFVAGFGAGYLSHLALDAATPRGLPILCR